VPDSRRSLLPDFAAMIAGWEWDVALLQEVLPWWPAELGRASDASARMALTSRNILPPLQRLVTERRPDLFKSWSGGRDSFRLPRGVETRRLVRPLVPHSERL